MLIAPVSPLVSHPRHHLLSLTNHHFPEPLDEPPPNVEPIPPELPQPEPPLPDPIPGEAPIHV